MRGYIRVSILVFLCSAQNIFGQMQATSNSFIVGIVEPKNGFVSVKLPPGTNLNPSLDFQDHSFFTCKIGNNFFTNNDPRVGFPSNVQFLTDGVTTKRTDTIHTVWLNKNGVDIIQDIYPIAFTKSGQIVYKWSFTNHNTSPVAVACQYLQDIQISDPSDKQQPNSNDGPILLTKYLYQPVWQQYPNSILGQDVPPFYVGFLHDLPNTPSFDPGLSDMGNLDAGEPLNLIKPFRVTFGNWYDLADRIFGASPNWPVNNGTVIGTDNAVLTEFTPENIAPGKTVVIGKTSYGTGEFETCVGTLSSVVFYPHHLTWDPQSKTYSPNPIHIEKFVVNPDESYIAANTKITLTVGGDLTISDSLCATPIGKTSTLPASGVGQMIAPRGVGYFDWWACATPVQFCTGPVIDTLKFTGTSSLGDPTFLNSTGVGECDPVITLDCAESDVDVPEFTDTLFTLHSESVNVHDWRKTDKGLQSITWAAQKGTDTMKIIVIPPSPPVAPCYSDKINHTIKIVQLDSTAKGCYDFTFTDCFGHQSFHTVCVFPESVAHPDSLAPVFTLVKTSDSRNGSLCSSDIDSFAVSDNNIHDSGLCSVDVVSGSLVNMMFNKSSFTPNDPMLRFSVSVIDSLHDGTICIRAVDCSKEAHFTDTCIQYCAPAQGGVHEGNNTSLILEANHPNPFSHITTFSYTIPAYGVTRLILYDELGKEMSRITDGAKGQGSYTIDFDGSKLPSGNYIVRLESSGGVVSRRVVIEH